LRAEPQLRVEEWLEEEWFYVELLEQDASLLCAWLAVDDDSAVCGAGSGWPDADAGGTDDYTDEEEKYDGCEGEWEERD
jgi:hypothetical protein